MCLNKDQGPLLERSAATVHVKVVHPWHLISNRLGYLIWNGCWVVCDCSSFKLRHVFSGSTGTRTTWAWWRTAQRCPHTTPKASCSWERSLWVTRQRTTSPLSTSPRGWVIQVGESNVCSVTSLCFLLIRSSTPFASASRLSWQGSRAVSGRQTCCPSGWTLTGPLCSPLAPWMSCCGDTRIPCWSASPPPVPMWRRCLALCTRQVHFYKKCGSMCFFLK